MATPRHQILSIQYLRAVAAISVVLHHQFGGRGWIFYEMHHGVDLFFVISGFFMAASTDGKAIGPSRFMTDRIIRIVPLYWIGTAIAFATAVLGFPITWATPDVGALAKSLLFVPYTNADNKPLPMLFLGWTLNYEMFYYFLFAAALLVKARYRTGALSAAFLSLVVLGQLVAPSQPAAVAYTNPLMLEFLAGVFLAKLFGMDLKRSKIRLQAIGSTALVFMAGISALLLPALEAVWFAVALVAVALLAERAGRIGSWSLLTLLGNASFSIYLFQQFAFDMTAAVVAFIVRESPFQSHIPGMFGLASAIAAISVGVLVWRYVEQPITAAVRAWVQRLTGVNAHLNEPAAAR